MGPRTGYLLMNADFCLGLVRGVLSGCVEAVALPEYGVQPGLGKGAPDRLRRGTAGDPVPDLLPPSRPPTPMDRTLVGSFCTSSARAAISIGAGAIPIE